MTNTNSDTNRNVGVTLVLLGLAFVFLRLTGFTLMSLLWPLWVLGPGALLLFMGFKDERAHLGWAIPGAVIGGTGAILALLNLTGRWEAWAYLWALYPVFIGGALYYTGRQNNEDKLVKGGRTTATVGVYQLIGFGLFFELLIFGGFGLLNSTILPVFLIVAGVVLYIFRDRINIGIFDFSDGEKSKRKEKLTAGDPVTGVNPSLRREMDAAIYDDE